MPYTEGYAQRHGRPDVSTPKVPSYSAYLHVNVPDGSDCLHNQLILKDRLITGFEGKVSIARYGYWAGVPAEVAPSGCLPWVLAYHIAT